MQDPPFDDAGCPASKVNLRIRLRVRVHVPPPTPGLMPPQTNHFWLAERRRPGVIVTHGSMGGHHSSGTRVRADRGHYSDTWARFGELGSRRLRDRVSNCGFGPGAVGGDFADVARANPISRQRDLTATCDLHRKVARLFRVVIANARRMWFGAGRSNLAHTLIQGGRGANGSHQSWMEIASCSR